jgi:hypothetical protein
MLRGTRDTRAGPLWNRIPRVPPPGPAVPRPPLLRRWGSLLWLLGVGGAVAATALLPIHGECGFRFLVGAPCPGCGMTRACLALARGDVAGSLVLHPLALPLVAAALAALALAIREGATGRPVFREFAERRGTALALAFVAALVLVWAVRVVWHPEWSPDPIRPGSLAARLLR